MRLSARSVLLIVAGAAAVLILLISRFTSADTTDAAARPQDPATAAATSAPAPAAAPTTANGVEVETDPGHGDEGHTHDDGKTDPPILVRPTQQPDVAEAAAGFTAAWLNTYGKTAGEWRAALVDRITPDMAELLADADPTTVPAGAKVGSPIETVVEGSLLNAKVPVGGAAAQENELGVLHLTFVRGGSGAWLVSEIDWRVAR